MILRVKRWLPVETGAVVTGAASVVAGATSVVAGVVVSVVDSVFSSLQDANAVAAIANTIKSFFMFSVLDFV